MKPESDADGDLSIKTRFSRLTVMQIKNGIVGAHANYKHKAADPNMRKAVHRLECFVVTKSAICEIMQIFDLTFEKSDVRSEKFFLEIIQSTSSGDKRRSCARAPAALQTFGDDRRWVERTILARTDKACAPALVRAASACLCPNRETGRF